MMYVAEAHSPKLTNATTAPVTVPRFHSCASRSGTKISTFFAHWCSRTAFNQLFTSGVRSSNLAAATVPLRFIPASSAPCGFAIMGASQLASSSTSGLALPM